MTTSTLHLNNPVPSNGAVVPSLGGRHTVTVTLAGVGAISCVVQAWGSEQGTDSRKIGAPVTVSGTTTVSQTLTFDADCKQFWLELVSLSPACKFNATVENDGTVVAPNIAKQMPLPLGGVASVIGSSTVGLATFIPAIGEPTPGPKNAVDQALEQIGRPWRARYHGYAGETNSTILPRVLGHIREDGASTLFLQASANDLAAGSMDSADAAIAATKLAALDALAQGVFVVIWGPHAKQGASLNAYSVARYTILMEEWCAEMGIPFINGCYAIANNTDLVATIKSGAMDGGETLHLNSYGNQLIAKEIVRALTPLSRRYSVLSVGYSSPNYTMELVSNPHFTGSGGTPGAAGVSGTIAANYYIERSGSAAVVASTGVDDEGSYMDLAISFSAASEVITIFANGTSMNNAASNFNGQISASKNYLGLLDYEILAGNAAIKRVSYSFISTSGGDYSQPKGASNEWANVVQPAGRRQIRTVPRPGSLLTAFTGGQSPNIKVSSSAAGSGTIRLRGFSFRETLEPVL